MSRRLTLICILAVVLALCVPAYAEVQNVKVSGDIAVRSLYRSNYDLDDNDINTTGSTPSNNTENFFMQSVGVNIDADLTDNVSTSVRLVNQRDWDNNSSGGNTFDVDIDLAYVTLKEMVYAPLTVAIGRQDLWFGRGLIVGSLLPASDATQTSQSDFNSAISADEYSETTAFDAIKATLDLAPWKLDLLYSKIDENTISGSDDVDLFGANVGYKFDMLNAETEAYYFGKQDASKPDTGANTIKVNTFGLRGSLEPITNLTVGAEGAIQRGTYSDRNTNGRDIKAYAFDAFGKYQFADMLWKPALGVEWLALSGEKDINSSDGGNTWQGWDAMYRGKFDTAIRDFQNYLYATRARVGNVNGVWDQDSGMSNQNSLLIKGSVIPAEDFTVEGTYGHFWLNQKITDGALKNSDDVGDACKNK